MRAYVKTVAGEGFDDASFWLLADFGLEVLSISGRQVGAIVSRVRHQRYTVVLCKHSALHAPRTNVTLGEI